MHLDGSGFKFSYVLVEDEAFPLTSYMMRSYSRSENLTMTKIIFNYRLILKTNVKFSLKKSLGVETNSCNFSINLICEKFCQF